MAAQFEYDSIFTPEGLAKLDQKLPSALDIKNSSTTFELTQANTGSYESPKPKEHNSKQTFALTIEECKPTRDYRIGSHTPLPSNVSFERVVFHVIDSYKNIFHIQNTQKMKEIKKGFTERKLAASHMSPGSPNKSKLSEHISHFLDEKEETFVNKFQEGEQKETKKLDKKLRVWHKYLLLSENESILADAFWYIRYKIIVQPDSPERMKFLLNRISKNYVSLLVNVDGLYKDTFFENYFNMVSQSVFYSLFYACPKSRDRLTDELKEELLQEFSKLLGGIEVANLKKYYVMWYLDLGAGNILKAEESSPSKPKITLPDINFKDMLEVKTVKNFNHLCCSPTMDKFLSAEKYKTRNFVRGVKMNFTKLDFDREVVEARFDKCKEIANEIAENVRRMKLQEEQDQKELRAALRRMKEDNWRHQRRLDQRRDEELANGAHEYANYLVSILGTQSTRMHPTKV